MIACILFVEEVGVRIEDFAEACFRFTPLIALRGREAVFLDLYGLSPTGIELKVQALINRFWDGKKVSIQLARQPALALALARYAQPFEQLPIEALYEYAFPFGIEDLKQKKSVRVMIDLIRSLGVNRLHQFLALPRSSLVSRFGKQALSIHMRIQGGFPEAWPALRPKDRFFEGTDVEELENLEGILLNLHPLIDRLMARLRGLSKRASVVEVRFQLGRTGYADRVWKLELSMPQGSASSLIAILRDRLTYDLEKDPLESEIVRIQFEVLETIPGRGAQLDYLSQKEEEAERCRALVNRLITRLGQESVFFAQPLQSYQPEEAWKKVLTEKTTDSFLSEQIRPSRILKNPIPLNISKNIESWIGPERIAGEWWKDPTGEVLQRDYYQIFCKTGEVLWVFKKKGDSKIYLHGYFD